MPAHHPTEEIDVWSVKGRFQQLIFSPKGAIEGLMIDTQGVPTQFVTDAQDPGTVALFGALQVGQKLVVEGTEAGPSPKHANGDAPHTVYRFERLVSIDGHPPQAVPPQEGTMGTVARFNYARHGEANGVVLDNGDFVHTRPGGLSVLGLKIGDWVTAEGTARALATGSGRVIEAVRVNDQVVSHGH